MPRCLQLLFVFKHRFFSNLSTCSAFATKIPLRISLQQIPPSLFQINSSYLCSLCLMHLPKNNFAATNNIKTFTTFIPVRLSSNVCATSTNNKNMFLGLSTADAFGTKIMVDSYLIDNFLKNLQTTAPLLLQNIVFNSCFNSIYAFATSKK